MSRSLPSSVVCGDGATRVLLAVVAGCYTYSDLIERTGYARTTIHWHLHRLRDLGLVTFSNDQQGTLRPTVGLVG